MGREVVWSPEALDDIEAIAEYIARDSEFYARTVVTRILETARNLPQYPFAGRVVPEITEESIREQFVYSYRLIYRVRDDVITIAAVIHGRRLLEPAISRIKET